MRSTGTNCNIWKNPLFVLALPLPLTVLLCRDWYRQRSSALAAVFYRMSVADFLLPSFHWDDRE